jgi:2,3-bisphosphoglycerate-dependent phosphoglycerate mutase
MKLILLRHEERSSDIGFFSELTEKGIIMSNILPNKLKQFNIDAVFSSPFIRTLQTIYPYSKKNNKKINIEYGLYEYLHNPYFFLSNWYYTINDINDKDLNSIINYNYNSIIKLEDFLVLEDDINLQNRIIIFFNYLNSNYSNKTVLLVTHKGVINKIKNIYIRQTNMDEEFEMGHFEVYDI